MGGGLSVSEQRLVEGENSALVRLVGRASLPPHDSFWSTDLNALRFTLNNLEPEEIDTVIRLVCERMVDNNLSSRNLNVMLALVCEKIGEAIARPHADVAPATVNLLFISRMFINYFVERLSGEQLRQHLDPVAVDHVVSVSIAPIDSESASHLPLPERLVSVLLDACVSVSVTKQNYDFHLELVKMLLALFSTQVYTTLEDVEEEEQRNLFVAAWQRRGEQHATRLCETLLCNFVRRVPHTAFAPLTSPTSSASSGTNWWTGLRTKFMNLLLWPFQVYKMLFVSHSGQPLSDHAAALLLVLAYQPPDPLQRFSFQACLQNFQDDDLMTAVQSRDCARVSFNMLYDAISDCIEAEWALLFLFTMLNENRQFCESVYSKSDVDVVVIPLLHMLYREENLASNKVYMILVVLLILTQDDAFSENVHRRLVLDSVPWFHERIIHDISLGSLITTVLLRTMQRNLSSGRDEYLHTNCLAAICNMAPHVCYMHEYTSQRLIGLLAGLARRYARLRSHAPHASSPSLASATEPLVKENDEFSVEEMATFGEFVRLLLQVVSACLAARNLPENIQLLYALLHDQRVLEPFIDDALFADSAPHIVGVLEQFGALLPDEGSVESIQYVLRQAALSLRSSSSSAADASASTLPKFSYEGLPDAEAFFLPYAWQLVCEARAVSWLHERVVLFDPNQQQQEQEQEQEQEHHQQRQKQEPQEQEHHQQQQQQKQEQEPQQSEAKLDDKLSDEMV